MSKSVVGLLNCHLTSWFFSISRPIACTPDLIVFVPAQHQPSGTPALPKVVPEGTSEYKLLSGQKHAGNDVIQKCLRGMKVVCTWTPEGQGNSKSLVLLSHMNPIRWPYVLV